MQTALPGQALYAGQTGQRFGFTDGNRVINVGWNSQTLGQLVRQNAAQVGSVLARRTVGQPIQQQVVDPVCAALQRRHHAAPPYDCIQLIHIKINVPDELLHGLPAHVQLLNNQSKPGNLLWNIVILLFDDAGFVLINRELHGCGARIDSHYIIVFH